MLDGKEQNLDGNSVKLQSNEYLAMVPDAVQNVKIVHFEEALERTGFGKYNWFLIVVCGICLLGVNNEAYAVAFILPSAECDLELDNYKKSVLTSTNFIGIVISCCFWGYLSDTKGRKYILAANLILAFFSSVVAALTPSFWGFAMLRFLNGIFISGPNAVIFAYFGEFQGQSHRSQSMALTSLFIGVATIGLPALGYLLMPKNTTIELFGAHLPAWRLFMLAISIPNLLVGLIFLKLPESPKFLHYNGESARAFSILQDIYTVNTGKPKRTFPVEKLEEIVVDRSEIIGFFASFWRQIAQLFTPPHLKYALAACLLQAGVFTTSSGLYMWYSDIVNSLTKSSRNNHSTICESLAGLSPAAQHSCQDDLDTRIFVQGIIIGFVYLSSYSIWSIIVNLTGNRNFFILCMAISSGSTFLVNVVTDKILIDVLFMLLLVLPGICVSVINLAVVDTIPTHLCGMAICITMTAGRLGSILSSSFVGVMLQLNCAAMFLIYAFILFGCLVLMFIFPARPNVV